MVPTAPTLAWGWKCHQAGDFVRAEQAYRQVVRADPTQSQAWYYLGELHQATGSLAEAAACLREALKYKPHAPEIHNSLGVALARQGRLDAAIACFHQALHLSPDYAEAHGNLGLALCRQGKPQQAIASCRHALRIKPAFPEAHHNLGLALAELGRLDDAAASQRQALALRPTLAEAHNSLGVVLRRQGKHHEALACFQQAAGLRDRYSDAHFNLGLTLTDLGQHVQAAASFQCAAGWRPNWAEAHFQLGNAMARQGKLEIAVAGYRQALALQPDYIEAHNNLGVVLSEQGKLDEATDCFAHATRLCPAFAKAHNNLGAALAKQDKFALAAASYRQALVLRADYHEAHNNLGSALVGMGQYREALSCYQRALQLEPGHARYHLSLAETLLHLGDLERGWAEMEWRWQATAMPRPLFSQPMWDGSPLDGRTILVYAEQGIGDTFQFLRYLPLVKQRGGTVLFQCRARLLRILSGCPGIDRLLPRGAELPAFDVQVPLMSLPAIFKTTLSTIPSRVPYLFADSRLVEAWGRELSEVRDFKVGIAWQGHGSYEGDRLRSPRLARFESLARIEGVRLFSLQKGDGAEQLAEVQGRFRVTDLGDRLDSAAGPFMDTAALMMNLDLIISSDTAVPHLAGALGVPVWVALPFAADWRWLLGRDDVPWYPTMRLFRQSEHGNWEGVFERLTAALRQRLQRADA